MRCIGFWRRIPVAIWRRDALVAPVSRNSACVVAGRAEAGAAGVNPFGKLRVNPFGKLRVNPFGKLRVNPFGKLRAGPFGKLRVNPFGKLRVNPFGKLRAGAPGYKFLPVGAKTRFGDEAPKNATRASRLHGSSALTRFQP